VTQLTRGTLLRMALALCACSVIVSARAQVPKILQHPQSQNTALNGNVAFNVVVDPSAPSVRYQWRLNGGNVPGAISNSLTISNVQAVNAGVYSVVVFNGFGAASSEMAELRINSLPTLAFSDSFDAAPNFSDTAGLVQSANFGATPESGEPAHAGRIPRRSVWATWIAPGSGIVTFRTGGSTFDTILAVYTGTLRDGLIPVDSDDDRGGFFASEVTFRAQAQGLYHIVVDGFGGAQGKFLLDWKFQSTTEMLPIFAEEPLDQTALPGVDVTFNVAGVSNYTWQWFFNGQPLANQTQTALRIKSVGPADVGDYFCRGFLGQRFRDTRAARLQIHVNDLGVGDPFSITTEKLFDVKTRADADPGKKSGGKSIAHGYSGTQIFSTIGSTKEIGEPNHCDVPGGASEWFAYQADFNGMLYIDTDGSNFDTVLAVYTGPGDDFATLVSAACDNNSGLDGKDSRVSFLANAGTIYWIAVDGVNNPSTGQAAKGSVILHYRMVIPLNLSAMAYTNGSGGKMTFKVSGTPNLAATIEAATNVSAVVWTPLVTNTTASGVFNYTNSGVGALSNRFYRALNRF
jgi:hypothetical protein